MYLFRSLQNLSVNLEYVRPKISYLHPFLTYFTAFTKNRCKIYSFYSTKMNITRIKTEAFYRLVHKDEARSNLYFRTD